MDITVKQHLKNILKKAHETQSKNGHFHKMAKIRGKQISLEAKKRNKKAK